MGAEVDKNQLLRNLAATEEEERYAREGAKRRAQDEKKQKAYREAYPEDAGKIDVWWLIGVVGVGLIIAWAYYGPIVRDAIYGVGG